MIKFWYAMDRFFNKCAAFCWRQATKRDPIWKKDTDYMPDDDECWDRWEEE